MKAILNRLTQHETLDSQEAESILTAIAEGQYNPSPVSYTHLTLPTNVAV